MLDSYYKPIVLIALFVITSIVLVFADPIAQDLAYHDFSDRRIFFGIPHFMDVCSNLPFLIVGLLGVRVVKKTYQKKTMTYFLMTFTLFFGVFLTGLGSIYYHYSPNNFTLIFDRLPMTLVFTAFFATIIFDYVHKRGGAFVFYGYLLTGVYSVLYWYYSEIIGAGDLRMYAFVQFFPVVAVPLILVFYRDKKLYTKQLLLVFGVYTLAKLCEHFDGEIYALLGVISGHTIKHLFSALAVYFIYQIYAERLLLKS